jgi:hypothetical protein
MSEEGQDPIELVGTLRDAFAAADVDALLGVLSPDLVWHLVNDDGTEQLPPFGDRQAFLSSLGGIDHSEDVIVVGRIEDDGVAEAWQYASTEGWKRFASGDHGGGAIAAPDPAVISLIDDAYTATAAGDAGGLRATLKPTVTWHTNGPGLMGPPSDYLGVDAVLRYLDWPMRVHLYGAQALTARAALRTLDASTYVAAHTFVTDAGPVKVRLAITVAGPPPLITAVTQTFI